MFVELAVVQCQWQRVWLALEQTKGCTDDLLVPTLQSPSLGLQMR